MTLVDKLLLKTRGPWALLLCLWCLTEIQNCHISACNFVADKRSRSCTYTLFLPHGIENELIFALRAMVYEMWADLQSCHIWVWNLAIGQRSRSYTCTLIYSRVPNWLSFALKSLVFQIIEVFGFSIGYNAEFEIFERKIVKNRKLKISKILNKVLWGPLGRDNSGKVWKRSAAICRRSSVLKFLLPWYSVHVNENEKYS